MTKRFVIKLIVFTTPLWLVVLSYFIFDPFKVLYHYDNFYEDYFVNINRDYASSQLFIQNNDEQHYNAFIFGSSRTMAFRTNDWKSHLDQSTHPYVFDAQSERVKGIWSKVKYLDRKNIPINHALIIICDRTFDAPQDLEQHLFLRDPRVYENSSCIKFQTAFLRAYFENYFFVGYLDYKFFRKRKPYMDKNMEFIGIQVDDITNDLYRSDLDRSLAEDSTAYYAQRKNQFDVQSTRIKYRKDQVNEELENMLKDIKRIFDKRKTEYEVIISPLYDQEKIGSHDLDILYGVFGKGHVHDFSGINAITQNRYNYYERIHFRPHVGKYIMDSIYHK